MPMHYNNKEVLLSKKNQGTVMGIRVILLVMMAWWSLGALPSPPKAFERLSTELVTGTQTIRVLHDMGYFPAEKERVETLERQLRDAFELGYQLDAMGEEARDNATLRKTYLRALRQAQSTQQKFYRLYVKALDTAMQTDDRESFSALMGHGLEPLENRSVKERIKAYYEPKRARWQLEPAEALMAELELVRMSREAYAKELQAYQTQFALNLTDDEATLAGKKLLKRFRNLSLYSVKEASHIGIYAHNENIYSVTADIRFKEVKNFRFEGSEEIRAELASNSWKKITSINFVNKHRPASFNIGLKMMMGWASAQHDDTHLYRVPFEKGKQVLVSQGFNGKATHKGDSRYAVDFQVPIGTPIVAAREGRVVAQESKYNQAGFERKFAKLANYIVIEHVDGTYGQYAHLKQGGVLVKLGEKVTKGQRIGYSGNTGFSSGPHLHFEVVKVSDDSKMVSVPIRFRSNGKVVGDPRQGDIFTPL